MTLWSRGNASSTSAAVSAERCFISQTRFPLRLWGWQRSGLVVNFPTWAGKRRHCFANCSAMRHESPDRGLHALPCTVVTFARPQPSRWFNRSGAIRNSAMLVWHRPEVSLFLWSLCSYTSAFLPPTRVHQPASSAFQFLAHFHAGKILRRWFPPEATRNPPLITSKFKWGMCLKSIQLRQELLLPLGFLTGMPPPARNCISAIKAG